MPGHAIAQKHPVPGAVHHTFAPIDRELEPLGQVAGDGGHYPLTTCSRGNGDIRVVRVAAELRGNEEGRYRKGLPECPQLLCPRRGEEEPQDRLPKEANQYH